MLSTCINRDIKIEWPALNQTKGPRQYELKQIFKIRTVRSHSLLVTDTQRQNFYYKAKFFITSEAKFLLQVSNHNSPKKCKSVEKNFINFR